MIPSPVGFQCPECVAEGMRRTRTRELPYGGRRSANPSITSIVLIVINAAMFALVAIAGGARSVLFEMISLTPQGICMVDEARYIPGSTASDCLAGGFNWLDGVATGAWWQPVTSAFMHADVMHIGFNMLALWFLGPQLEQIFGRTRFLALYFVSLLMASAFVMWLSEPAGSTVGASGAIFGLMGAILLVAHKHKGNVRTILMWLGANVVITVVGSAFISWQGHLGGFVGGLLVASVVMYLPKKSRKQRQWPLLGLLAILALALIAARAFMFA